jgi:hypothetical protein
MQISILEGTQALDFFQAVRSHRHSHSLLAQFHKICIEIGT